MSAGNKLLYWLPRVLGILTAAFLSMFALDAFAGDAGIFAKLGAFAIHLIPAAVVLAVVAIAWRWEIAGGLLFIAAGIAYVLSIDVARHPDWIAVVAGPLWLVGALFLISRFVRSPRPLATAGPRH